MVVLSTAVEYAALWIKNPKFTSILQRSLDSVLSLRSNLLRHGIFVNLFGDSHGYSIVYHRNMSGIVVHVPVAHLSRFIYADGQDGTTAEELFIAQNQLSFT